MRWSPSCTKTLRRRLPYPQDDALRQHVTDYIERGETMSWTSAAILSAVEQYEGRFGVVGDYTRLLRAQDAVTNEFDANTLDRSDIWHAIDDPTVITPTRRQDYDQAVKLGIARGGIWTQDGPNLVFAFSDDEGTYTAHVVLENEDELENTADAIAAFSLAKAGVKHTLADDQVPGTKTAIGGILSVMGDSIRWVENNSPVTAAWGKDAIQEVLSSTAIGINFDTVEEQALLAEKTNEERAAEASAGITDQAYGVAIISDAMLAGRVRRQRPRTIPRRRRTARRDPC